MTDDRGRVHLSEFFPLTTLADDLTEVFERNRILREFAGHLLLHWRELTDLWERARDTGQPPLPRDVRVVADTMREIAEWAVAMHLALEAFPRQKFDGRLRGIVLHDGTLRSIPLRSDVICERLPAWWKTRAWGVERVAIVGVGKSSIIWQRLSLALGLDGRIQGHEACYVTVPPALEQELARPSFGTGRLGFGRLVLVKTRSGAESFGQFLPVDVPEWILADRAITNQVLAQVLKVSKTTFPQPGYATPLENAHESARLSEFDAKLVRDLLMTALRDIIPAPEYERMLRFWAFSESRWKKTGRIGKE